jgi:hypothetical protein
LRIELAVSRRRRRPRPPRRIEYHRAIRLTTLKRQRRCYGCKKTLDSGTTAFVEATQAREAICLECVPRLGGARVVQ